MWQRHAARPAHQAGHAQRGATPVRRYRALPASPATKPESASQIVASISARIYAAAIFCRAADGIGATNADSATRLMSPANTRNIAA